MDFFTSDQHFGHKNIIKYCNRPFESVTQMDDEIISKWNEAVGDSDTVYVVGDVSFYNIGLSRRIIKKLNGKKILIRGNHDKSARSMIEMGFDQVFDKLDYELPDGRKALLYHYPMPDSLIGDYDVLIHGHTHAKPASAISGKKFNVCVDAWDFTPVSASEVCNYPSLAKRDDSCEMTLDDDGMVLINARVAPEDLSGMFNHLKSQLYKKENG